MKTKKLLKTLVKSQKYRIKQLRDNNQTVVNDLARKIESIHADREVWILRFKELERNLEKDPLEQDIKNELECPTIWFARDKMGKIFLFTVKPLIWEENIFGLVYQGGYSNEIPRANELEFPCINSIQPLECKQFRLLEVKDGN